MAIQNLPNVGDKLFLIHREVVVAKVYKIFRLVEIHFAEEKTNFFVDASALAKLPDKTNSISLELFRGNRCE